MAAAVQAESRMQRCFQELEAAEAAAEAEDAAAAAGRGGRGRGFLGTWFGGGGRAGRGAMTASAAASVAGGAHQYGGGLGPSPPRAGGRGPRMQRSRRGPAAEAEFAGQVASGSLFGGPPFLYGAGGGMHGRGALFGEALQQIMFGLRSGLPADLLLR